MTSTGPSITQRCCRLLQYGLLVCLLPPLLNHAALQTERQQLRTHGQLHDVGSGQMMYLRCDGEGAPTVILDSPAGLSSDFWLAVLPRLSQLTRTCVFDRPGLGFSDRPMPPSDEERQFPGLTPPVYTAGSTAADLHRLLADTAKQPLPLVYVGAGLGAMNARLYAHLYPSEVSDLVLVDPLTEDLLAEHGVWLHHVRHHLLPPLQTLHVAAAAGLTRLMIMFGMMEPPLGEAARLLGEEAVNRQKHLQCHPRHASTVVDEHHFLNETAAQLRQASQLRPLAAGRPPITVITGDKHDDSLPGDLNGVWRSAAAGVVKRMGANRVRIDGADWRMAYTHPERLTASLRSVVRARRAQLATGDARAKKESTGGPGTSSGQAGRDATPASASAPATHVASA